MSIFISDRRQLQQSLTYTQCILMLAFMQVRLTQLDADVKLLLISAAFNIAKCTISALHRGLHSTHAVFSNNYK